MVCRPRGTCGAGRLRAAGRPALEQLAAMERWSRALARALPAEPVAAGGAALGALLLVVAYATSLGSGSTRAASLAAAGAFLLLVAVGVSVYAWRLEAPGRFE
jgi:hypothetical protein